jgi:hypothetical protein
MRSTAIILLLALSSLKAEAELRFTDPQAFPDIGLEMPTLFAASPDGVSMPHTESFLVTESDGSRRLEDRYDTFDLWTARTVRARWRDAAGNLLVVARLAFAPPDDPPETLSTRSDFERRLPSLAIKPKDAAARNAAVVACAPVDVFEEPVRPRRSRRREIETLLYYQSTNQLASVWVFRPVVHKRGAKTDWYMAALVLSPDENPDSASAQFDAYFLDRVRALPDPNPSHPNSPSPILNSQFSILNSESSLLKRDYALSVVNYEGWHSTESGDVVVVDDLAPQSHDTFVSSLTNDLPRLRAAYAASVPSPLVSTNIAAVRVFSEREDYLAYVGEGVEWSAAVWSPRHRELVLNLTVAGMDELIKTVRHEAFHQYLAYAGAMAEASPWFNEGHAELFAHTSFDRDGKLVFEKDAVAAQWVHANADAVAAYLPAFVLLDYADFYSGTDAQRRARYHIAWSIAYFLEVGAPEVRFRPFKRLRADYMSALVRTRRAEAATTSVFTLDKMKLFSAEWKKFWKK